MGADAQAGVAGSVHAPGGRDTPAEEVAQATLDAIERSDRDVLAFTAVDPERVLADARVLDEQLARGIAPGPLWGVPVAVKDVIDVEGLPTSYGTPAAPERTAMRDAFCVARLREAGALVVGKTRTSELAWRGDTPPTRNPRWPRLIPGGSSGGSAAAVAAGHVPAALGTDTGGSVRWPAVMCGLVGLKPTYGAISLQGVSPCSWSLDHVGVLARSIEDVRRLLRALVWPDPAEPRSAPARLLEPLAASLAERCAGSLGGRTLGVLDEDVFAFADPARAARFEELLSELPSTGAAVVRLRLPLVRYASAAVTAISLTDGARLSHSLRADLLSNEVRTQLQLAQLIPAPLVTRAQQVRAQLARDVARLFREHKLDALLTPAMTAPPLTREELEAPGCGADGKGHSALARGARTFYLPSLTGQPAAILPLAGVDGPDAVQLIGRPFADDDLLALAETLENGLALRSIPTMDRPSPTR